MGFSSSVSPQIITSIDNDNQNVSELKNIKKYKPDWDDLDSRILPQWYDDAKIGE